MQYDDKGIRLLAFDYDGTLAATFSGISRRTRLALARADQLGYRLVLATGRSLSMIPKDTFDLPFSFYITSNGARTNRRENMQLLGYSPMEHELVMRLLHCIAGNAISINAQINGMALYDNSIFRVMRGMNTKRGNLFLTLKVFFRFQREVELVKNVERTIRNTVEPIEKIVCIYRHRKECRQALEELQEQFGVCGVSTSGYDIEITAAGVDKGRALAALCRKLDISSEEVMAFGDSSNDLSMRNVARYFMVPETAGEDIRAAADRVIKSAAEDGVALLLEEFLERA